MIEKTKYIFRTTTTPYSPTCTRIMDLFLANPTIYFTSKTASLTLDLPFHSVKNCMNLLFANSYLSKESHTGHTYHITKENMEFWVADFREHVLNLQRIKEGKYEHS